MHGECKTCATPVISACPVWEGQTPDVKYIAKDYSGKFIKPTTDSIEEILKDKKHEGHQSLMDWVGMSDISELDFESFDSEDVVFRNPATELQRLKKTMGV